MRKHVFAFFVTVFFAPPAYSVDGVTCQMLNLERMLPLASREAFNQRALITLIRVEISANDDHVILVGEGAGTKKNCRLTVYVRKTAKPQERASGCTDYEFQIDETKKSKLSCG